MNLRAKNRGAAALAVALLMLFGMTLVAFFANRGMLFEQRTSANQARSTRAFELADAGLQWAIARVNDPSGLGAAPLCNAAVSPESFNERYIRPRQALPGQQTGTLNPLPGAYPGCEVDPATGNYSCACPTANAANLPNTDRPRFRVQFNVVAGDPLAVELVSRGCTNGDPCDPTPGGAGPGDSTAIARVLLKVLPTISNGGGAGLVSGSTTVISGSLRVVNTDTASNGITINTGSTVIESPGTAVQSLPGTPPRASILDNDPSLLQLTNADPAGDLFFTSFMGENMYDYQYRDGEVKRIVPGDSSPQGNTCTNDLSCGQVVSDWIDRGWRKFWVEAPPTQQHPEGELTFNNSNRPLTTPGRTFGTEKRDPLNGLVGPVVIATPSNLIVTGGIVVYGLLYCATATAVDDLQLTGGGTATVFGMMVSRGDFARTGNGNVSIIYRPLFAPNTAPGGRLVPVPGSWRDKATAF